MDTVPGAAAKPSWTISQPEPVPSGCSGKFLLRWRAVRCTDLPLGFLSWQVDVQFRAGTALSAHRIAVLARHDVIPVREVAVGQSPGERVAGTSRIDDVLHLDAIDELPGDAAGAVPVEGHAATLVEGTHTAPTPRSRQCRARSRSSSSLSLGGSAATSADSPSHAEPASSRFIFKMSMYGSQTSRSAHALGWRSPLRVSVVTGPWASSTTVARLCSLMCRNVGCPTS